MRENDIVAAHRHASHHKESLQKDTVCGCFYCLNIFHPREIEHWLAESGGTALCPYCAIDSVIGESSGFPITKEFLSAMRDYWFEGERK